MAAAGITLSLQVLDPSPARAATHAFDTDKGVLAVDYAKYLRKHDIVYNAPNPDPKQGLTVGNGKVGAMAWNANGLSFQVTAVDGSQQTAFSGGWAVLQTKPRLDSGYAVFQQTLDLYDGILVTRFDEDRRVTVFGIPGTEVLGFRVEDGRAGAVSATFDVKMWDPATEMTSRGGFNGMQADVPDINPWKAIAPFADSGVAGFSRGQADADGFGYTLAAAAEGASVTAQPVDGRTMRLSIAGAKSYTLYLACASRATAAGRNSVAAAKAAVAAARAKGFAANYEACLAWWHGFWDKSFVQFSNTAGDADYLENYWYLATYMIASGSYGKYPFHFINGVYRHDGDKDIHWSGAYWWWNMRDVYGSFLASNHADALDGLLRMYQDDLPALKARTQALHQIDGAWVPETMGWDGNDRHTTESDYTRLIFSTGAEVARTMFQRFAYTQDSAYLRTAYPFIRECAKFLAAKFTLDAGTGKFVMLQSNAHETYWKVKNAITDLAAARMLFPIAIGASEALGQDAAPRDKWKTVLDGLIPYKTEAYNGGQRYLPHDPPAVSQNNGENITSELIWPYDLSGLGSADYQTALNSFNSRPSAYSNVWSPDPIQAARLGLGDAAFDGMKQMLGKYQTYPNGLGNNDNGVFEFTGVHPIALNESLLHGYGDTLRVFPALPNQPALTARFTLRARGGFLVSSEREGGEIKYVGIRSLAGRPVSLANPWGSEAVVVRQIGGPARPAAATSLIAFPTTAGATYVIERQAKPLSGYAFAKLAAAGNFSAKSMKWNAATVTLGSGQGSPSALPGNLQATSQIRYRSFMVAGSRFAVPGAEAAPVSVSLHDLSGRMLARRSVRARILDVRDFGLPPGAYLARVRPLPR
jgi:hypothetical protein